MNVFTLNTKEKLRSADMLGNSFHITWSHIRYSTIQLKCFLKHQTLLTRIWDSASKIKSYQLDNHGSGHAENDLKINDFTLCELHLNVFIKMLMLTSLLEIFYLT